MKKIIVFLFILTTISYAYAATAYWTGRMEYIQTVTYKQGVKCEYRYMSQTFWQTFTSSYCPQSIEIQ